MILYGETLQLELKLLQQQIHEVTHILAFDKVSVKLTNATLLTKEEIIAGKVGLPSTTGIYFLIKDNEVVFHQWILSCRIFNRDIEFKVLNDIIERLCNNHKITNIVIEVKETGKNKYFFDFIDKINSTKRYDREKIVLNLPIKFHKNTVKSTWILN